MVYDEKLKKMVTARQKPQMVKVESVIKEGKLILKAPNSSDLISPIDATERKIIDTELDIYFKIEFFIVLIYKYQIVIIQASIKNIKTGLKKH